MFCMIGGTEDDDFLWLAAALARRGEAVEILLPDELVVGSRLSCRIEGSATSSSLHLADGRRIQAETPGLVINRLANLPSMDGASSPGDAAYLEEEWRAALVAWLRTVHCPVLNPPRAGSLVGPQLSMAAWRSLANAHGLAARPWRSDEAETSTDPVTVVCVAGNCVDVSGSAPAGLATSLVAMARYVGAPLLGATFDRADDAWLFLDATAWPPLASAGSQLVDAIVACARDEPVAT